MSDTPPPSNSSSGELSVPWPAFTMKYCKLPIELCWDIIDAIPSSLYFLSPCEHDTLVACKNVCTMWRTHAEAILMRIARLNSPQIVSQFVSAIRRESPGRMRVDSGYIPLLSLDWFSFEGDKNLSRAMDLFMSPLPSDTGLFMSGVRIEASPRVLRCIHLPLLTGIRSLYFSSCQFYSWRAMLDIVWGCPKLEVLSVWCYSFEGKTPTPESIARLGVARRSLRGCLYLKELCICMHESLTGRLLPGDVVFGVTLTKLSIFYGAMRGPGEIIPLFRDAFQVNLESIDIHILGNMPEVAYDGPCLLLAFATTSHSHTAIHSIFIHSTTPLAAYRDVSSYVPEQLEQIIGRAEEWDGRPLRSLLTGLQRVKIQLHSSQDRAYGEACVRHVLSVLPGVHDILQVSTGRISDGIVVYPDTATSSFRVDTPDLE